MSEKLKTVPFSWDENFAEEAAETLDAIRESLSYCAYQDIAMALAKLRLLEEQGCKVKEDNDEIREIYEL